MYLLCLVNLLIEQKIISFKQANKTSTEPTTPDK